MTNKIEAGDYIVLKRFPSSCNRCEQINDCRQFAFAEKSILFVDLINEDDDTLEIECPVFTDSNSESVECLQHRLTIPVIDCRYADDYYGTGYFKFNAYSSKKKINNKELNPNNLTEQDVDDIIKKLDGLSFFVDDVTLIEGKFIQMGFFDFNGTNEIAEKKASEEFEKIYELINISCVIKYDMSKFSKEKSNAFVQYKKSENIASDKEIVPRYKRVKKSFLK